MRFVRYRAEGAEALGILDAGGERVAPLEQFEGCGFADMNELIRELGPAQRGALEAFARGEAPAARLLPLAEVELLAPIGRPVHDILCVGVNYQAHFDECERAIQMKQAEAAV